MRISDWSSDVCSSDLEGRKSKGVRGRMTVDAALTRLLEGSGLSFRKVNGGSYVVSGPSKESYEKARRLSSDIGAGNGYVNGQQNIPEILVLGKRSWSLNTDIPRSKDEAQPYTVFTREEIKRSGAPDRSEEHTSELQSLMRISYAVVCLKK